MSPESELTSFQMAVLLALAEACNYSEHAHPPIQAIERRFKPHLRGDVKRNLKRLCSKGYASKHPTGGETTYNITSEGLRIAKSYSSPRGI